MVSCPISAKINTASSLVKEVMLGLKSPRRKAGVRKIDTVPTLVKEAMSGLISPRKKSNVPIDTNPTLVKEATSGLGSPRKRRENSRRKAKSVPQEKPPDVMLIKDSEKNSDEPVVNSSTHQNLSTDQAMRKLKRKLIAGGFNDELRPIANEEHNS